MDYTKTKIEKYLELSYGLLNLLESIDIDKIKFNKDIDYKSIMFVFNFLKILKAIKSVIILVNNDLSTNAIIISRSIFEVVLNHKYTIKYDLFEQWFRFGEFEQCRLHKLYEDNDISTWLKLDIDRYKKESLKKIDRKNELMIEYGFKDKEGESFSMKTNYQMSLEVDLKKEFRVAYKLMSFNVHSISIDMLKGDYRLESLDSILGLSLVSLVDILEHFDLKDKLEQFNKLVSDREEFIKNYIYYK